MPVLPPGPTVVSPRELDVLQLVAEGQSNDAIGAVLHLSPWTVKTHLRRIGRKLGNGDRAGMVAAAFRKGILK